jgi:hypothetical protein
VESVTVPLRSAEFVLCPNVVAAKNRDRATTGSARRRVGAQLLLGILLMCTLPWSELKRTCLELLSCPKDQSDYVRSRERDMASSILQKTRRNKSESRVGTNILILYR